MSVDTLTFSVIQDAENVSGRLLERVAEVTLSAGYPTGGYTFPTNLDDRYGQIGIKHLIGITQIASNTAGLLFLPFWDRQAETLYILRQSTGLEVADNTDLHTSVFRIKFVGSR